MKCLPLAEQRSASHSLKTTQPEPAQLAAVKGDLQQAGTARLAGRWRYATDGSSGQEHRVYGRGGSQSIQVDTGGKLTALQ